MPDIGVPWGGGRDGDDAARNKGSISEPGSPVASCMVASSEDMVVAEKNHEKSHKSRMSLDDFHQVRPIAAHKTLVLILF